MQALTCRQADRVYRFHQNTPWRVQELVQAAACIRAHHCSHIVAALRARRHSRHLLPFPNRRAARRRGVACSVPHYWPMATPPASPRTARRRRRRAARSERPSARPQGATRSRTRRALQLVDQAGDVGVVAAPGDLRITEVEVAEAQPTAMSASVMWMPVHQGLSARPVATAAMEASTFFICRLIQSCERCSSVRPPQVASMRARRAASQMPSPSDLSHYDEKKGKNQSEQTNNMGNRRKAHSESDKTKKFDTRTKKEKGVQTNNKSKLKTVTHKQKRNIKKKTS
jgi:hypothetical protein